jgi:hypothetical protein
MFKNKKINLILIFLLFLGIAILVLSKLIFNDYLIGRFIDFSVPPVSFLLKNVLKIDFYTWNNIANGGLRSTFSSTLIPVNSILYFPAWLGCSVWFISRYQMVLPLVTAMFSFFLLARKLLLNLSLSDGGKRAIAILGALFFTLNNYFFCELIFGSTPMYFTFALIPLFLYFFISYISEKRFFFFPLTLISLMIISSTLQHFVMTYIFMIVFGIIYKEWKAIIKVIFAHLILSLYWILPFFSSVSQIRSQELSVDFSNGLVNSSTNFISSLINKDYFGNRLLYTLSLGNRYLGFFWTINAFLLLLLCLYALYRSQLLSKLYQKITLWFAGILILSLLFIKGGKEPFGLFVLYLYKNFTPINLYRSLQHYIGFYVIAVSILFILSSYLLIKKEKRVVWLIFVLVLINASPWFSGDLGRRKISGDGEIPSYIGEFKMTEGDFQLYNLNQRFLDFSLLTIPPNYSVYFMPNAENSVKSQGGDTGLGYGNKPFYAADVSSPMKILLDSLERSLYIQEDSFDKNSKLFSLLNIKYLTLRGDVEPASSENLKLFNSDRTKEELKKSSVFSSSEEYGETIIYKFKEYLPIIYSPKEIVFSSGTLDKLIDITSSADFDPRSLVIFDENQKNFDQLKTSLSDINQSLPVIEYRHIDSTKYRLVIHKASGMFPLILSESYNSGWEIYPTEINRSSSENLAEALENYKIFSNEVEEQASTEDIKKYIEDNFISTLGNNSNKNRTIVSFVDGHEVRSKENYNVEFVSKNNFGTIQNNNLEAGKFWQSWGVSNYQTEHFVANGFTNGWLINTDDLCSKEADCLRNPDGSYDLELTIEYRPQKLFYIGATISGSVLLLMLFYLFWRIIGYKIRKNVH